VLLSNRIHHKIHFEEWWKELNMKCIKYLRKIYE
jgi:hypothetical protein